jgi:hypothetical protein
VVSENLSKAADQFEVLRRVVFYNGITGDYMLTDRGLLLARQQRRGGRELTVTCKIGNGASTRSTFSA